MQKLRSHVFFKPLVLGFLIAFRLGAFSNMFFIPSYAQLGYKIFLTVDFTINKFVKAASYQSPNFIQVIDKSNVGSGQQEKNFIPKCLLLIFTGFSLFSVLIQILLPPSNVFYNRRNTYLSFCTLRI